MKFIMVTEGQDNLSEEANKVLGLDDEVKKKDKNKCNI